MAWCWIKEVWNLWQNALRNQIILVPLITSRTTQYLRIAHMVIFILIITDIWGGNLNLVTNCNYLTRSCAKRSPSFLLQTPLWASQTTSWMEWIYNQWPKWSKDLFQWIEGLQIKQSAHWMDLSECSWLRTTLESTLKDPILKCCTKTTDLLLTLDFDSFLKLKTFEFYNISQSFTHSSYRVKTIMVFAYFFI